MTGTRSGRPVRAALLRSAVLGAVLGAALLAAPGAPGAEFSYNGLLRSELALSTTGARSLAADAGTRFDNQGRDLNLAALRLELEGVYRVDRQLSVTGRLRGWGDWTNQLDSSYVRDADLFAGDDYAGNAALLSSTGARRVLLDVPELYVDWRSGPLWLRGGKHVIAWGDAIGMRILDDMISSLDLRRHGGNFDLAGEEFADERIGQLGLFASLRIPETQFELDVSVSDFSPTVGFPAGSAYANFPGAVTLLDAEGVRKARQAPAWGVRLTGQVLDGRGEVTLAYARRPQSIGVLSFDAGRDLALLLGSGNLPLRVQHPRISMVGGAFSYTFSADPLGPLALFDGLIARVEGAYYFDKRYSNPTPAPIGGGVSVPFAGQPIIDDELSVGVVLEKSLRLRPEWLSTTLLLEGWYRSASDLNDTHQSLHGDDYWNWYLLSINQNLHHNEVTASLNTFFDTSGGWFLQPAVVWRPSHRLQVDVFYNLFEGGKDDVYGALDAHDELVLRVGWQF